MLTAFVIIFKNSLATSLRYKIIPAYKNQQQFENLRFALTVISGIFLGIVVSISSVGAGAIGTAVLFILYPNYPAVKIIGTDLAHAVPLTAVAGLGHFSQQHVSLPLLSGLLIGGIPMVYLGSQLGKKLSDRVLRVIIATMLFSLGIKLALQ
ncbi:MAG TPA: sulfite exporter TauE/SafE family protein [Crenotrichaceae bacterium]|nr:sulfite exporter TauE/SafE family protein [Crenotrichaceae bacterium]